MPSSDSRAFKALKSKREASKGTSAQGSRVNSGIESTPSGLHAARSTSLGMFRALSGDLGAMPSMEGLGEGGWGSGFGQQASVGDFNAGFARSYSKDLQYMENNSELFQPDLTGLAWQGDGAHVPAASTEASSREETDKSVEKENGDSQKENGRQSDAGELLRRNSSRDSAAGGANRAAHHFAGSVARRRDRSKCAPKPRSINDRERERLARGEPMLQPSRAILSMTRPRVPDGWESCRIERQYGAGELEVGRSLFQKIVPSNHLKQISSTHFAISCGHGSAKEARIPERGSEGRRVFIITDRSENGTSVNESKIGKGNTFILKDGDRIGLNGYRGEEIVAYLFSELYDDDSELLKSDTVTMSRGASLASNSSDGALCRGASKEFRRFLQERRELHMEVQDVDDEGNAVGASYAMSSEDSQAMTRRLGLVMDVNSAVLDKQLSDSNLQKQISRSEILRIQLGGGVKGLVDVEVQGRDLISSLAADGGRARAQEENGDKAPPQLRLDCVDTELIADAVDKIAPGEGEPTAGIGREDLGPSLLEDGKKLSQRSLLRRKLIIRRTKGADALATANLPQNRQLLKRKLQMRMESSASPRDNPHKDKLKAALAIQKRSKTN